jgi:CBS domain-containing protein
MSDPLLRDAPCLRAGDRVGDAVRNVLDSGLPALPVIGDDDRLCGIFGEREFMAALFPGYLTELKYAGFVPRSLEAALEKRSSCRLEPVKRYMNTEHIDVGADFSDAQVAEIFLHHRVLLVPVVHDRRVTGVITRADFFRALAERFLASG